MKSRFERLYIVSFVSGLIILLFIVFPIINTLTWTDLDLVMESLRDAKTMQVIFRSIKTATITTALSALLSIPFAYFIVRHEFKYKKVLESLVDIPMVLPHTVAGITLLTVLSKKSFFGRFLVANGIEVLGTEAAIVLAMSFVSLPLMFDAAKEAFKWVSPRMENVSRSLGASHGSTFFRITLPLASKDLISGLIITWARAISEYGAVIILAYHPMIAPTLIYERYTTYGINYAIPVTIILLVLSLLLFVLLRLVSFQRFGGRN